MKLNVPERCQTFTIRCIENRKVLRKPISTTFYFYWCNLVLDKYCAVVHFPQDETMRLLHTIRSDSCSRQQQNNSSRQAPRGSGKLRTNGSEYDWSSRENRTAYTSDTQRCWIAYCIGIAFALEEWSFELAWK